MEPSWSSRIAATEDPDNLVRDDTCPRLKNVSHTHRPGGWCCTLFPVETGLTDAVIARVRPKYQNTPIRSGLPFLHARYFEKRMEGYYGKLSEKSPNVHAPVYNMPTQATFTDHGVSQVARTASHWKITRGAKTQRD